jgi:hypothetical protein
MLKQTASNGCKILEAGDNIQLTKTYLSRCRYSR